MTRLMDLQRRHGIGAAEAMRRQKAEATMLPSESPICVHRWVYVPTTETHECQRCGYRLTSVELVGPHEGDGDPR